MPKDKKYDVIVVGAGVAGASTALRASMLGLKTLLIERTRWPGEKNVSVNGKNQNYAEALLPEIDDLVPKEKLMAYMDGFHVYFEKALLKNGGFINFNAFEVGDADDPDPTARVYVSNRNQWDRWFADIVVKRGVELMTSTLVVDIIRDGATVKGVITDKGEKIEASITVAADGTNSIVTRKAGLRPKFHSKDLWIAAEVVYEMGSAAPEEAPAVQGTFNFMETELIDSHEVGYGYGWIYYLKQSDGKTYLKIGTGSMAEPGGKCDCWMHTNTWGLLARIGQHMIYNSYVSNGKLVAMSCKACPDTVDMGCYGPTYGNGILVVGDAGIGTCWQGMGVYPAWDCAIIAADVAKKAIEKGDVSAAVLKEYEDRWKQRVWVADAALQPWVHGKWRTEDGMAPFLRKIPRIVPGMCPAASQTRGQKENISKLMEGVIVPALANVWSMVPNFKPANSGVFPKCSVDVSETEKEWAGKNLSDKIKSCTAFIPTKENFIRIDESKCDGCGKCYRYCMGGVFDMDDAKGKAVVARLETCMECGTCFHICPKDAVDWNYPPGGTGMVVSTPGANYWDDDSVKIEGGKKHFGA